MNNIFYRPSARQLLRQKLDEISVKIEDNLDIDFSHVSKRIDNIEDFNTIILDPFLSGETAFRCLILKISTSSGLTICPERCVSSRRITATAGMPTARTPKRRAARCLRQLGRA